MADLTKFYAGGSAASNGQTCTVRVIDVIAEGAEDNGTYPLFNIGADEVLLSAGATVQGVGTGTASMELVASDDVKVTLAVDLTTEGVLAVPAFPAGAGADGVGGYTVNAVLASAVDADVTYWAVVANIKTTLARDLPVPL